MNWEGPSQADSSAGIPLEGLPEVTQIDLASWRERLEVLPALADFTLYGCPSGSYTSFHLLLFAARYSKIYLLFLSPSHPSLFSSFG